MPAATKTTLRFRQDSLPQIIHENAKVFSKLTIAEAHEALSHVTPCAVRFAYNAAGVQPRRTPRRSDVIQTLLGDNHATSSLSLRQ